MVVEGQTSSMGCWTITWMPGEFRKEGTDVHTLPGVPFFILTIRPERDVVYPGPGQAGTSFTLIGVYIDPCAKVQHLPKDMTPIQTPDRLVSDELAQDKIVDRLISQCAGGPRGSRPEDFKKKDSYGAEDSDAAVVPPPAADRLPAWADARVEARSGHVAEAE